MEKRRLRRKRVRLRVNMEPGGVTSMTGDLTEGGLFMYSARVHKPGTRVHLVVRLPGQLSAEASGVVTWSGKRYGYGKMVEINHGNGLVTRYAHNQDNLVKVGEKVRKGQSIAQMGSSGRSTGPHVHFEVLRNGNRAITALGVSQAGSGAWSRVDVLCAVEGAVDPAGSLTVTLDHDAHLIVATIGEGMTMEKVMGSRYGKRAPIAVSNPTTVAIPRSVNATFKPATCPESTWGNNSRPV